MSSSYWFQVQALCCETYLSDGVPQSIHRSLSQLLLHLLPKNVEIDCSYWCGVCLQCLFAWALFPFMRCCAIKSYIDDDGRSVQVHLQVLHELYVFFWDVWLPLCDHYHKVCTCRWKCSCGNSICSTVWARICSGIIATTYRSNQASATHHSGWQPSRTYNTGQKLNMVVPFSQFLSYSELESTESPNLKLLWQKINLVAVTP